MKRHGAKEYPFLSIGGKPLRPILFLHLRNRHAPENEIIFPALIDTGADCTLAPFDLCELLGHEFEKGKPEPDISGVAGSARVFSHETAVSVLSPVGNDCAPKSESVAFGPFETRMQFADCHLRHVLIGQRDFLNCFEYGQDGKRRLFWLRRLD